jgi:dipeptidyl aminopeptidase/acylaminoacyl peptidase
MAEEAGNKVSAIVTEELLYRHWNYWKAGKVSHLFSMNLETGKINDLTPGERWVPFGPFDGAEQYSISPDSKAVAYSKRTGDQPAFDTNDDIYLVPIDGGESRQITSSKGSDKTPDFSPDGKYISYVRMKRPGFEADRQELVLYSLDKNDYIDLTPEYDGDVLSYLWTEDSKTIYFTSESRARRGLYKVNINDKKVENFYNAGKVAEIALTPDQESLIYTWQDARQMYEIYRFDIDDTNPVQLTKMNAEVLGELEMNPVEDIDFRGAGGDMVHALMLKPPFFNESKKYPLILIIHGGPQNSTMDDFHLRWNLQLFASRGYVVLGINFHGSSGYGQKFKDGVTYDWGGLPFRDIMIGLDYVLLKYNFIDRERIAAAGASYGGYMVNWIAGHTDRFKCLVSHSGVYNFSSMYGATEELWFPEYEYKGTPWTNPSYYRKDSPDTYVKRFTTPTLIIHGQQDFRVPVTQSMEFFTALQKMGVESKFIYFPDECHFVLKPNNARFWYNSVLDWIDTHTKK